ncbi:hypothetical protein [Microbacterium candidum]|uniref:Uncharacterized protein n=1 Tax=Microbacterium candidum TaxID=3041922 RepID=A0ABT7N264_9MICO|nr:hypothetical protein [Microbacterium sp. ASV49]MDL9980809.1 hypothetical protein [Microbacterium sp. ASV49]
MQTRTRILAALGAAAIAILTIQAPALALENPTTGHNGAPTNTCYSSPATMDSPGRSASANGSPFNPNGTAGLHYAGNPGTASLAHSNSTATVSQYDTACLRHTAEIMRHCASPGDRPPRRAASARGGKLSRRAPMVDRVSCRAPEAPSGRRRH